MTEIRSVPPDALEAERRKIAREGKEIVGETVDPLKPLIHLTVRVIEETR